MDLKIYVDTKRDELLKDYNLKRVNRKSFETISDFLDVLDYSVDFDECDLTWNVNYLRLDVTENAKRLEKHFTKKEFDMILAYNIFLRNGNFITLQDYIDRATIFLIDNLEKYNYSKLVKFQTGSIASNLLYNSLKLEDKKYFNKIANLLANKGKLKILAEFIDYLTEEQVELCLQNCVLSSDHNLVILFNNYKNSKVSFSLKK